MKNKILFVASIILFTSLFFIILRGKIYYNDRVLPNTYMSGLDISKMTEQELLQIIEKNDTWEEINVFLDNDITLTIYKKDINYHYTIDPEIQTLTKNNKWTWFTEFNKRKEVNLNIKYNFDHDKIKNIVSKHYEFTRSTKDAELTYNPDKGEYEITPHEFSLSININEISNLIINKINKKERTIDLSQYIVYPNILDNNEQLNALKDKVNSVIQVELTYDFGNQGKEIVNSDLLSEWIKIDGEEITFDKDLIKNYIVELAEKYDTFGKSRDFTTTSGKIIKTSGGAYGWLTHRADSVDKLLKEINNGENKNIELVYSYTALSKNKNDIGDSYVEIDIENQMVYVYDKGELKVSTPTVTGNLKKGHDTPLGVDPVNYKTTNAVLRGPGYASPVKYWMPFNGGVGLHDANWRTKFGGEIYKTDGSHGCINLPLEAAKEIYNLVFPGMPVIVY